MISVQIVKEIRLELASVVIVIKLALMGYVV